MAKCENPDCPHKAWTAKFGRLVGSKWMLTCLWCDNQMGRKALVEHGLSYEEAMKVERDVEFVAVRDRLTRDTPGPALEKEA